MGLFNHINHAIEQAQHGVEHAVEEVKDHVIDKPTQTVVKPIEEIKQEADKIIKEAQDKANIILQNALLLGEETIQNATSNLYDKFVDILNHGNILCTFAGIVMERYKDYVIKKI